MKTLTALYWAFRLSAFAISLVAAIVYFATMASNPLAAERARAFIFVGFGCFVVSCMLRVVIRNAPRD